MRLRRNHSNFGAALVAIAGLAFSVSCGAPPPPAAPPPPPPPPPPPLSILDGIPDDAGFVAQVVADRLRAAPLLQAYLTALAEGGARGPLDAVNQKCGFSVTDAIDELVVAVKPPAPDADPKAAPDALVLARIHGADDAVLACLKAVGFPDDEPAADGHKAVHGGAWYAALLSGKFVAIGSRDRAFAALTAIEAHHTSASKALHLFPEERPQSLVFSIAAVEPTPAISSAKATVVIDEAHFVFQGSGQLASADEATRRSATAQSMLRELLKDLAASGRAGAPTATRFLSRLKIQNDGPAMTVELRREGGPFAQAEAARAIAEITIDEVQRRVAHERAAEAKAMLGELNHDLFVYMDTPDARGQKPKRFPPSAPLTPSQVPAGATFAPDPKAWSHATWKALHFEPTTPLRYSYEIETSKDGRTAVVRAHGDLDGDGKASTFTYTVKLGPKGEVQIPPELELQLEDELE